MHMLCRNLVCTSRATTLHSFHAAKLPKPVRCMSTKKDFDDKAYESERLKLDEQAREAMAAKAAEALGQDPVVQSGQAAGAWKWVLRKKMWDYMEANDIASVPRPVHHRIPNFVDADLAAKMFCELPEFQQASVVKVNPDTPQRMVRYHVMDRRCTLVTPQPRLRTGFFNILKPGTFKPENILDACTSKGSSRYGKALSLEDTINVDLVVVGSCVVSTNGCRLGKGEGFAELEYGVLRWMGAITADTPVVTTVHDCQVVDDNGIDPSKMLPHDVPVDIIVTPTRIIRTNTKLPKPSGVLWDRLSPEKLEQIPILQRLKMEIEMKTGKKLPSGPSEILPPTPSMKRYDNPRTRLKQR